ncbi:MAG TPA: peptidylprolyl isomerase [Micropepsaceae bacterium]|nr:peptidylprolyl isomerase [Micropepsaceae bacterium]
MAFPRILALSLLALPAAAGAQAPAPAPVPAGVPVAQAANPEPISVTVPAPVVPEAQAPEAATMPAPPAAAAPPTEAVPAAPVSTPPQSPLPGTPPKPEGVVITGPATISQGVVAIVNDFVISDYDLDQRVALFAATSGTQLTKDTIAEIRQQVLRSMEDEVLELQEATKHKVTVTKADVDKAIQNIADDNHVTSDQIMTTITRAGVKAETFRQQVAAQLIWQRLVTARYGTDILINDQQINEAMDRLRKGADRPQFLVSEIFIAVDKPEDDMNVRTSAQQMAQQLTLGAPFRAVASQFSQSPSAADGGDIGWVIQGQLAEDLDRALAQMRPGDTTPPIRSEGGYYILQLRDRREPIGTMIADDPTPMPTDPDAPVKLDRLLIPLPTNVTEEIKQRALNLANNVRRTARSCADLPMVQMQLTGTLYTPLGEVNPKDLSQDVRDALSKTGPGEVAPPFFSPAGLEIIMRCDPPLPQKLVAFKLPTRDELQQELFVQQMSVLAKSYLRDLRRDAVVETR